MIYGMFAVGLTLACILTLVYRIERLNDEVRDLRSMVNRRFDSYSYRVSNIEKIRAYDAETCRLN